MSSDKDDDPSLPDRLRTKYNRYKTRKGWDFEGGIMYRPPPREELVGLQYVPGPPEKKEPVIVPSREDSEALEQLIISVFYEADMVADEIFPLMTVYNSSEICDGDTLFIVEDKNFQVITGKGKSLKPMTPLSSNWVQFVSGYLRRGTYTRHGILWDLCTPFPSSRMHAAFFPESFIDDGNVYKIYYSKA